MCNDSEVLAIASAGEMTLEICEVKLYDNSSNLLWNRRFSGTVGHNLSLEVVIALFGRAGVLTQ